ncbi:MULTISPECIES: hypothetical protein [unclassified Campylobacter]|uniref:hypothetical protein n=1 Tax=unclassified Campylobacter TaxID=2593542 RepID=UPI0022E99875|nr:MULTISPECIES: hypothetical protein [unclassified Campylobacter]MDA3054976.1 hypothetical protein [Campylobacter sp. VBCF_07 NA4]MDA3060478.1 hypothetical protein [Campylobacter sp. VBCF_02 NA5]MDA3070256.1 hypothetical protein [Campylobacter sp. VBCF_08 NA3]WBR54689.1 hypothetical protein PF027_02110 [Campylobacter sp. VBCF_01 NA2]
MSRKRKILNIFLAIFLVFIFFIGFDTRLTTGLDRLLVHAELSKGDRVAYFLEENYEFSKKLNLEEISENFSSSEQILFIGTNDGTGGLLKDISCIFSTKEKPNGCWNFFLKENGKIKMINFDEYQNLSDQNITEIVIKRKFRRFKDF